MKNEIEVSYWPKPNPFQTRTSLYSTIVVTDSNMPAFRQRTASSFEEAERNLAALLENNAGRLDWETIRITKTGLAPEETKRIDEIIAKYKP
jgi:hypothetical protein